MVSSRVVGLDLLDGHLGVARYVERMGLHDLQAGEKKVEVGQDQLLDPDEDVACAIRGRALSAPAPADDAVRHLHPREMLGARSDRARPRRD